MIIMRKYLSSIFCCLLVCGFICCASKPASNRVAKNFIYQDAMISRQQFQYVKAHWGSGVALSQGKRWLESQGVKFSTVRKCSYEGLLALFAAKKVTPPADLGITPDNASPDATEAQYGMYKLDKGGWFIAFTVDDNQ
jgi:hypothetical protein